MSGASPSPALRRHLRELSELEAADRRVMYWHPAGSGERRCAAVGERLGLLTRDRAYKGGYEMTRQGRAVGAEAASTFRASGPGE